MNKIIATLILAASFAAPSVASAKPVLDYEKQLDIVGRYNRGTIQADVEMSQGKVGHMIQIVGANAEQTEKLTVGFWQKVNRNMEALRWHKTCVVNPAQCKNTSWQPSD